MRVQFHVIGNRLPLRSLKPTLSSHEKRVALIQSGVFFPPDYYSYLLTYTMRTRTHVVDA